MRKGSSDHPGGISGRRAHIEKRERLPRFNRRAYQLPKRRVPTEARVDAHKIRRLESACSVGREVRDPVDEEAAIERRIFEL